MSNLSMMRKARTSQINLNPFTLSGILYTTIDNGYGQQIENRSLPVAKSYTNSVRIFKKKKMIKNTLESNTPYTYEEVYYLMSDYETVVDVRLEFTYQGMNFKVKTREPLLKYGGVISYQYELDEITEVEIA